MKASLARLSLFAAILGVILTACRAEATSGPTPLSPVTAPVASPPASAPAWLDIPLEDVRTGATFKLSDYAGQVVVLEVMAVWCPLCLDQQNQIRLALKQVGEKAVAVSVDVDPGEDAATLAAHANANGLSWSFAVAPPELSQALVSDYGPGILSPPSTPVILIDPAGIARKTPGGIKKTQTLIDLVNAASH